MMMRLRIADVGAPWLPGLVAISAWSQTVLLNEVMYHPASENPAEEYIELYNAGTQVADLTGWRLTGAVELAFSNAVTVAGTMIVPAVRPRLNPGGHLVVAANLTNFVAKYPGITNVVGNWQGQLSNNRETIRLLDSNGATSDSVTYADEGDWALRQRGPLEYGYRGWKWFAGHDGLEWNVATDALEGGSSLERVNPLLPHGDGQNWLASVTTQGTPGRPNSVATANVAPFLLDVAHLPAVPTPSDPVTITARVVDEQPATVQVTLHYRNHSTTTPPPFQPLRMRDDATQGDGGAGDGVYGVVLPAHTNGTVIEFYLEAADAQGRVRTWPAAARQTDGSFSQTCNALYQVDDRLDPPSPSNVDQPLLRLVLTGSERDEFQRLMYNVNGQFSLLSNAEMNGTLISTDGTGTRVRYNVGVRLRGSGSRWSADKSWRVNIPSDRPWDGLTAINLNINFIHAQMIGSAFALQSGLPAAAGRVVQVRLNGVNHARSGVPANGSGLGAGFGSYCLLEPLNQEWADRHFPGDGNGNLYRAAIFPWYANLDYEGPDWWNYTNSVSGGYLKASNQSENDWSDLVALTLALSPLTPEAEYVARVRAVADVEGFLRYFAVVNALDLSENGLARGVGDDYALYRGMVDPRFRLIPYDLDTVLGQGDAPMDPNRSIWRVIDAPSTTAPDQRANFAVRLLRHPEFAPLYFRELKRLCDTTLSPAQFEPLVDQVLGGWVPGDVLATIKSWAATRRSSILSQLPLTLTVSVPLGLEGDYYRTTEASVRLSGTANALDTARVVVGGLDSTWSVWEGRWTNTVALEPGLNRIPVQCLDRAGRELGRTNVTVWRESGDIVPVGGALSASTTWGPAAGSYRLVSPLTVPDGRTLTIAPGTTIYLDPGLGITVQGQLLADGTETHPIRFARPPGETRPWAALYFDHTGPVAQRLTFVRLEGAGAGGTATIRSVNAVLELEHLSWSSVGGPCLVLENSSLTLLNSVLPDLEGHDLIRCVGLPAEGHARIAGNWFGQTTGNHDVVRFTGGNRPGPIVEFLDNTFTGAADDVLVLESTDAHIEGNLFAHVHQDSPRDDAAHAIATGRVPDNPYTSELVVVRNLFFDCDHALLLREGASALFANNTVVGIRTGGVTGATASVLDFGAATPADAAGREAHLEGNIVAELGGNPLVTNFNPAVSSLEVTRTLVEGTNWPGVGNLNADPRFVNADPESRSWRTLWDDLALRPGSPALGTGPNGRDMGALVAAGASISGETPALTASTAATLAIAGPGITHYSWKLNDGSWSGAVPIEEPLVLTGLANGTHTVSVVGRNSAGSWQAAFAPTVSWAWTVNTGLSGVRLDEILARNRTTLLVGGGAPDLVELFNFGGTSVDLSGMGLTDDPLASHRFTFPPGTSLAPGQRLVLFADNGPDPARYLGFGLDADSDALYLHEAPARGGALLDSVRFGPQVPDVSLGRDRAGDWVACEPTFGAPNRPLALGDPRSLRLNEWLAAGTPLAPDDFLELYNPEPVPVALGGLFLTDAPPGLPTRHAIAPLSFIAANGFVVFKADGEVARGADHLNFRLDAGLGHLGLFAPDLTPIDLVWYGPQRLGVSQGRQPNGSGVIAFFPAPTPGTGNPRGPNPTNGAPAALVLSEVAAAPATGSNPRTTPTDWVELHNPSTNTVNLAGWSLTDSAPLAHRWVFPNGATLPPDGRLVVRFNGDVPASYGFPYDLNTGFGLNEGGDAVQLYDATASLMDAVVFGPQAGGFTLARAPGPNDPWTLGLPTPGAANLAAGLGNAAIVRINEWAASVADGADWFELHNPGLQPVALGGFYLTDKLDNRTKHRLADLTFLGTGPAGYLRIVADNDPAQGADHVGFSLDADGEAIALFPPGTAPAVDTIVFGPQTAGVSEGRFPDGGTQRVFFSPPSPGAGNWLPLTNVVINEILTHTDPPLEDAIELHNPTTTPVDLSGWWLSDTSEQLLKFPIPAGTILAPRGFAVFYEYQFNPDPGAGGSFALDAARGGSLWLCAVDGAGQLSGFRAHARFGPQFNGVSFGRVPTSVGADFASLEGLTFGTSVTPASPPDQLERFRTGRGASNAPPRIGPVAIAEIQYHPPSPGGVDNGRDEFIELCNLTTTNVPLYDLAHPTNGWRLRGAVAFDFTRHHAIPPNGFLVLVSFDPLTNPTATLAFRALYGPRGTLVGPYQGLLDNGGGSLELHAPDAPETTGTNAGRVPYVLLERVLYDDRPPWPATADGSGPSLQRVRHPSYANDPSNWTAAVPSVGSTGLYDADGDGLPDAWEESQGTYLLVRDDQADPDLDGFTNREEYIAGTDPHLASSRLAFRSVTPGPQGTELAFDAVAGKTYTILYSDTLSLPEWKRLLDVPPRATTETATVLDPAPAPFRERFYRLVTPSLP
jgi:hypothetical protein